MVDEPIFALILIESDIERPRILKRGSLGACMDELLELVLMDAVARNRARVEITSTRPDGGKGAVVTVFQGLTLGRGVA